MQWAYKLFDDEKRTLEDWQNAIFSRKPKKPSRLPWAERLFGSTGELDPYNVSQEELDEFGKYLKARVQHYT
jgi:hypothetical protein